MARASWAPLTLVAILAACAAQKPKPTPPPPLSPAAAPATEEAFRLQTPPPLDVPTHLEAPVPKERLLANGVRLWVHERHDLPLVSILAVVMGGVEAEPPGKAGLAGLTASMLTEGTRSRTSQQIAVQMEDLAIDLWSSAGAESSTVGLNSLRETLEQGVDVFADVLLHPSFPPNEFARVQKLALTALEQRKGMPDVLAADALAEKLYGPQHPWGQPSGGTPDSVRRLKTADLAAFHRQIYGPAQTLLVVVGDITLEEAAKLLEPRLRGWKKTVSRPRSLPPFPKLERTISLTPSPGSQAQLWLGGRLFSANDPDAIAARLANLALGGMFSSRLNQALREEKAFSYGFYSNVQLLRDNGIWLASGSVESKHTAEALEECLRVMTRYADEGPNETEMRRARERYIGALPGLFETNGAIANALATLYVHAQPHDYFRTLPMRVKQVTREDVQRVTRAYLIPKQWPVVIVGPREGNEALESLHLGPLELRNP